MTKEDREIIEKAKAIRLAEIHLANLKTKLAEMRLQEATLTEQVSIHESHVSRLWSLFNRIVTGKLAR